MNLILLALQIALFVLIALGNITDVEFFYGTMTVALGFILKRMIYNPKNNNRTQPYFDENDNLVYDDDDDD